MMKQNLSQETQQLASRLIEVEKEILELLEICNYDPNKLFFDDLIKYNSRIIEEEEIRDKLERSIFFAIPNKKVEMKYSEGYLRGLVRVYVACNSTLANFLPQEYDRRLRTIALVRCRNDPDFRPEEKVVRKVYLTKEDREEEEKIYRKIKPVVAPSDERVVEEEIQKLGFEHLPTTKFFFVVLAEES
jgi:hypothetical protein